MTILLKHRIPCFHDRPAEPQIPRLRSPGFPVELDGAGGPHAPFLKERRTPDRGGFSVAGNPGRDDKKERAAVRKEWLLNRGFFNANLDNSSAFPVRQAQGRPFGTKFEVPGALLSPWAAVLRTDFVMPFPL
jgi:hypothetical protein